MRRLAAAALAALAVVAAVVTLAAGHGLMVAPRQRGALKTSFPFRTIDPTAPQDYCPHCLNAGGTGGVSSANGGSWSLYDPLDPTLGPARARDHGACGDPAGENGAHMAGGRFYHGGKTVETYTSGGTIDFELAITAHHNGFMEWWVCDVDKCRDDDPTGACFATPGACVRLDRVPHPACEAGTEADCGPIQAEYPSRWYLPCKGTVAPNLGKPLVFGGPAGKMRYRIPAGFSCTRCVAQWYWASANSCAPPGHDAYSFPSAWTNCPSAMPTCGAGAPWPEEFWSCSDVRINPAGGGGGGGGVPPVPSQPQPAPQLPPPSMPAPAPAQPEIKPRPSNPELAPRPQRPVPTPAVPGRPSKQWPPKSGNCMAWGSWCVIRSVAVGGECCAGTSCSPYSGSKSFSMCL